MNVHPTAWEAEDLRRNTSWTRNLSADAVSDINSALTHALKAAKPLLDMTGDDFPINEGTKKELDRAVHETQSGFGLCLLKGFPTNKWDEDAVRLMYWGVGLHLGVARIQNRNSDYLTDVRDTGATYKTKNGRGYNTSAELDFHTDSCDVVALLCRRPAKSGGLSKVSSTMAICNYLYEKDPKVLDTLRKVFYHSYQDTQREGDPPYFTTSVLGNHPTCFALRLNRKNTNAAQKNFPDLPRLTPEEVEAFDTLDGLMADPRFCYDMQLAEGDLQLLNNHVIVHSRSKFDDFQEEDKKRHLLRLWLAVPHSQPLPASWAGYFADVRPGATRGGVPGKIEDPQFRRYEARQSQYIGMAR